MSDEKKRKKKQTHRERVVTMTTSMKYERHREAKITAQRMRFVCAYAVL